MLPAGSPSPIWPVELFPHAQIRPSLASARLWFAPHETAVMSNRFATCTGTSLSVEVAVAPHSHAEPSGSRARLSPPPGPQETAVALNPGVLDATADGPLSPNVFDATT